MFANSNNLIFYLILLPISLFIAHRILRFIYNFIRYLFLSYKYRNRYDRQTRKNLKNSKKYNSTNTPLSKDLIAEQKQELEDIKKMNQNQGNQLVNHSDRKIVAIAEPIGAWTKFVTKQKISWLKAMVGSKTQSDKFWQNIIKAQQRAQGKAKGRSGRGM